MFNSSFQPHFDQAMSHKVKGRPDMIANDAPLTWQHITDNYGVTPVLAKDCVLYANLQNVRTISDFEACGVYDEWASSLENHAGFDPMPAPPDPVNNPDHYTAGGIKTIDYMAAKLSSEEFTGYLKGNVLKYVSRAGKKGEAEQDLKKAQWYLNRLIKTK